MLSMKEKEIIKSLKKDLDSYKRANKKKRDYYESKNEVKDLGVQVPAKFSRVKQSVGWIKIAVDSILDRINFLGYSEQDRELEGEEEQETTLSDALNASLEQNDFSQEFVSLVEDMLIYGVGYVLVGKGDPLLGEPETLITVESPNRVVSRFNKRRRTIDFAAYIITEEDGGYYGELYTDTEVIPFYSKNEDLYEGEDGRWEHGMKSFPVVMFKNRGESDKSTGHSEISEAYMTIVDSALRTLLNAEISQQYYATPARVIISEMLANDEEDVHGDIGGPTNPAQITYDRGLLIGDPEAKVQQLPGSSPDPYISMLKHARQDFAAASSLPESYLGSQTAAPTSADSIRATEAKLNKKSERVIDILVQALKRLALVIHESNTGEIITADMLPVPGFRSPETPTRAATADEVQKLIASGVLQPNSELVFRRLGFSRADSRLAKAEYEEAESRKLMDRLASTQPSSTAVSSDDMLDALPGEE